MELRHKIKALRKEHHLTQRELANKINCSKNTITSWERGIRSPNPVQRKKLCQILDITEPELFGAPPIIREPGSEYLTAEILEALQDPVARKGLLLIFKSKKDLKEAIYSLLETLPHLPLEKRQAILALCK